MVGAVSDEAAGVPAASGPYRFDGPVAVIQDPEFLGTWIEDEEFVERLVRAADPEDAARKRVAVEFQRAMARMVAGGRVAETIDGLLVEFLSDDYLQHDALLSNGREPLASFFKSAAAAGIDLWPPMPVCVMAEGDVVSLLLRGETPDGSERFIPTMFRVVDGRMTEHWSAAPPPPLDPPAA